MTPRPPRSTLFPSRRSSDLEALDHVRLGLERAGEVGHRVLAAIAHLLHRRLVDVGCEARCIDLNVAAACLGQSGDRKSTRLNSSHMSISYAVFCLKKKNKDS